MDLRVEEIMRKIHAFWHLNRNCNFKCDYCYIKHLNKDEPGGPWQMDIDAFKATGFDFQNIHMSGGEPFIYPDFVKLCEEMTKFSNISISTNLSTNNVKTFAEKIDADKVDEIIASVHIGQRRDYKRLLENIKYLEGKGFKVHTVQVMHPDIFTEYALKFVEFKYEGIFIQPKVLESIEWFKMYPNAYTQKQKDFILDAYWECRKYAPHVRDDYLTTFMVDGELNWKGQYCWAGFDGIQIQYNGDVYRCHGDKDYLGNLYVGDIKLYAYPKRCRSSVCNCEPEGIRGTGLIPDICTIPDVRRFFKKWAIDIMAKINGR